MTKNSINEVLNSIQCDFDEKIALRRSATMDVFEGLLDTSPHWPVLRKKLLGFFGDSGIQGDFNKILITTKSRYMNPKEDEAENV